MTGLECCKPLYGRVCRVNSGLFVRNGENRFNGFESRSLRHFKCGDPSNLGLDGFIDTDSPFFIHGQDFTDFTALGARNEAFCITFRVCFSK